VISSMTGYAENRVEHEHFSARIAIKTLNHRYFDWNFHGDRFGDIEDRLRKICKKSIYRGRVDVFLEIDFIDSSLLDIHFDKDLLKKITDSLQEMDADLQGKIQLRVEDLFEIPHLVEWKRRDFSKKEAKFLEAAFESTLELLLIERRKEGKRLLKGIEKHAGKINRAVTRIEELAAEQPSVIRKKLLEKIEKLGQDTEISDEKIAEETAFYAQRYDLDEEIQRIKSHLCDFESLLSNGEKEPAGKKLDFTSQEILREANTINSKTQEIKIIKYCLEIKSELESIRQQVRNLE
jgi:uncharacterized protein (TIGR00255 family)